MRRKNALEYIMMALFIMCITLALSAALEYASVGTQRPFLLQGAWMLGLVALSLVIFVGIRVLNKLSPRMSEKKKNLLTVLACAVLFLVGLGLRMLVITRIPVAPASDYETYYRIAGELLNDTMLTVEGQLDRRYVAMYPHTIGFPMMVLLPAFRLFGQSVKVAQYANLVCSMVSLLLCAHIGKRLAGRLGAVLAMLMMALWPSHVLYANMVATEQSFTMFILMAADLMVSALGRDERSLYARHPGRVVFYLMLMGIVLALAGAVRPMAILLLASFAVVQLMQGGDPEGKVPLEGARYALSRGWVCVLMVVIPYLMTQAIISRTISDTIMEEPASGLTASGYNLMVGVNVKSEGRWNEEDSDFFGSKYDELGDANEAHAACMQVAIQRITSEPENVLNLLVFKFRDLWQTDDFGIDWNLQWTDHQGTLTPELKASLEALRPGGRLIYMAVLLYALLCALNAWRGERTPQPLVMISMIFFLGTALSHMLLETQVRYHYNMLPFLMLLATVGVVSWRQRLSTEPVVHVVHKNQAETTATVPEHEDNTHFDMRKALLEGNIIMTVTQAYEHDATFNKTPAPPSVPVEEPAAEAAEEAPQAPVEAAEVPTPVPAEAAEPAPEPEAVPDLPAPEEPTAPEIAVPEAAAPEAVAEETAAPEAVAADLIAPEAAEPEAIPAMSDAFILDEATVPVVLPAEANPALEPEGSGEPEMAVPAEAASEPEASAEAMQTGRPPRVRAAEHKTAKAAYAQRIAEKKAAEKTAIDEARSRAREALSRRDTPYVAQRPAKKQTNGSRQEP